MKTLLLTSEDIQNFNKLIYDPKSVQLANVGNGDGGQNSATCNLMALQYYLKHPSNYPATTAAAQLQRPQQTSTQTATAQSHHQQLLAQSQTQLKQLQLKQPTVHQQHTASYHHHPYYQQTTTATASPTPAPAHTSILTHNPTHAHNYKQSHTHTHTHTHSVPVHALNQNSNFSAVSSSTGGTNSSHAPTQQSNTTTGSGLSPPGASASARNVHAHTTTNQARANADAIVRSNFTSSTKKLKTEPVLSQYDQSERLSFANSHIVWNEEHWKRVVFQDERKFNLDGPDGFSYYFHDLRNYERSLSQRPRGYSVYIYLVVTAGGPIHLEISAAKLKPETCIETILRERTNIATKLGGQTDFILQDHNWILNTLPNAQEWLSSEGIKTQKWPTIAHDLNIMENVWGWLIREVYDGGRKFSRKDDLIFRIREAWARLPMDLVTNLYSTLPERITELYYTRGIYTNC